MMEKIFITVEKSTRMVNFTKKYIGNDLENLQQELVFKFTDNFVDGSARLEYQIGGNKYHIPMTKEEETYTIPIKNVLTKEGKILMQLVVVQIEQNEEIPVFKSNVFEMFCNKSINSQTETPDDYEYWLDVIQTKLASIDEALEEVDNLDIDASKSGNVATLTITKKDGTSKSVEINDGQDGTPGLDGKDAKINGYNTVTIESGTNINLRQVGNTLTIENTYDDSEIISDVSDLKDADIDLQNQIDAITSSSDVVDVVGTYQELQNYDTTKLTEDDVVKVLQDSTHNNSLSYYRWSSNTWEYIGSEGPFYTKSETDTLLNTKQNTINNSNKLNADLVDDTNATNKFVTSTEKTIWNNKLDQSDLADYVKNTNYASGSTGGVIKGNAYGFNVLSSSGQPYAEEITYANYQNRTGTTFIGKGTLEKVITGKELINQTTLAESQEVQDKEFNYFKTIYNAMPKLKGTGTDLTIDDTVETMLKMDLSGNTYQYSTTGKQLYNVNDFIPETGVTVDNDGWYTVTYDNTSGSSTIYRNAFTSNLNLNTSTEYAVVLEVKNVTYSENAPYLTLVSNHSSAQPSLNINLPFSSLSNNSVYKYNFTTKSDFTGTNKGIRTFLAFGANTKGSITFRISVLADTSVTPQTFTFEPYTGTNPSPSPDYPQDIEVVTGDNTIEIEGKNLLNLNNSSMYSQYASETFSEPNITITKTVSNQNAYCLFAIGNVNDLNGKTLKFTGELLSGTSRAIVGYADSNGENRVTVDGNTNISAGTFQRTITVDATTYANKKVVIWLYASTASAGSVGDSLTYKNVMVSENGGDYQPYTKQTYPINLGDIELCKIGDYKDEFYLATERDTELVAGKWYVKKNTRHISLAISDMNNEDIYPGWKNQTYLLTDYPNYNGGLNGKANFKCNILGENQNGIQINSKYGNGVMYLPRQVFNLTQTEWITNYPNLVFEVIFNLANTSYYILLNDVLQTQLNTIKDAMAHQDQTNISQTNDEQPFIIDYETLYDMQKLVTRVATLEAE